LCEPRKRALHTREEIMLWIGTVNNNGKILWLVGTQCFALAVGAGIKYYCCWSRCKQDIAVMSSADRIALFSQVWVLCKSRTIVPFGFEQSVCRLNTGHSYREVRAQYIYKRYWKSGECVRKLANISASSLWD
jgi:hypothetical protein